MRFYYQYFPFLPREAVAKRRVCYDDHWIYLSVCLSITPVISPGQAYRQILKIRINKAVHLFKTILTVFVKLNANRPGSEEKVLQRRVIVSPLTVLLYVRTLTDSNKLRECLLKKRTGLPCICMIGNVARFLCIQSINQSISLIATFPRAG